MDRNMFEAGLAAKKEEMVNEAHGEAIEMDEKRDELKKQLAEIEGVPEVSEAKAEQKEAFKKLITIEINTGLNTAADFEKALKGAGCEIGDYAKVMLAEVEKEIARSTNLEKEKLDLVEATPADLGLPNGGTLEQIYAAAEAKGLEICPAEVGPQARIQYPDQPNRDYRLIGMKPLVGSGGGQYLFSVSRDDVGRRWLNDDYVRPRDVWSADDRFVFVRRKSEPGA